VRPTLAVYGLVSVLHLSGCRGGGSSGTATDSVAESSGTSGLTEASTGALGSECAPGTTRSCYEGSAGSQGLGICHAGQQTCNEGGETWSACEGSVQPQPAELCDTPEDDDCDGTAQCEPTLSWWQEFPSEPDGVVLDSESNAIIVGTTNFFDFQGVAIEGTYVLKLDPDGQILWTHNTEGLGFPGVTDIVVDAQDRITIVGFYEGAPDFGGGPLPNAFATDAFVARFGADGVHQWSHGFSADAFSSVAVGPDGSTYVVGQNVDFELDGLSHEVLVVAAYDPMGEPAWVQEAYGVFGLFTNNMTIALSGSGADADEVLVMANMGDEGLLDPEIGGLALELESFGPHGIRLDLSGTPLGQQRLMFGEEVYNVTDIDAFPLPDGTLSVVANASGAWEDSSGQSVLLGHFDATMQAIQVQRVGDPAWAHEMAPAADGTILVGLGFGNVLELGPIGVGVPQYGQAIAVSAVDHEGQGRWLELLHSEDFLALHGLSAGPEGSVLVAATVGGATTFAGELVYGSFVAKLRP